MESAYPGKVSHGLAVTHGMKIAGDVALHLGYISKKRHYKDGIMFDAICGEYDIGKYFDKKAIGSLLAVDKKRYSKDIDIILPIDRRDVKVFRFEKKELKKILINQTKTNQIWDKQ